jgi:REP element-mobilizing transposase RayT
MHDPDKHHRRSIRLRGFDYRSASGYFLTICTHDREPIFAVSTNGVTRLTPEGEVVRNEWLRSGEIRNEMVLDAFVVMPNHIHGIVVIVGAHGMPPDGICTQENRAHGRAPLHRSGRTLGSFVAGFKSACTKQIKEMRGMSVLPVWQRNYYERIIRNDAELNTYREYIATNPAQWHEDDENPTKP